MEYSLRNLPRHQALWDLAHEYPDLNVSSVESYLLFVRVASDIFAALQDHLDRYELSDGKLSVLMILRQAPDYTTNPSQIAEAIGVTRSTMTGLLAGLERMELIAREADRDDGRVATITLTPRGLGLLEKLLPGHLRHLQDMMSNLTEDEQQQLVGLLAKIAQIVPPPREP